MPNDFIHTWNLKTKQNKNNEQTEKTENKRVDTDNRLVVGTTEEGG